MVGWREGWMRVSEEEGEVLEELEMEGEVRLGGTTPYGSLR